MEADVLIGASRFADEGVVHQDISHNNVLYDERQKMFRLIEMGLVGISRACSAETFPFMDALKALPPDRKADVVRLLNRMIAPDPEERASAQELLQAPLFGEMPPRDGVHAIYKRLSGPP